MKYLSARTKEVAIKIFAVIGFIAVLGMGFWLSASLTNFSYLAGNIGSATAYLGSIFTGEDGEIVATITPTELVEETPIKENAVATTSSPSVVTPVKPQVKPGPVYEFVGASTSSPQVILYGLPDLFVTIKAVGYLATSTSLESFVASSTVPFGKFPAVRFTITNQGTNVSGEWRLSASIPTQNAYIFSSPLQKSLTSGEETGEYILYFDQATAGTNKMISITANSDSAFAETTRDNNSASANITILGS